MQRASSVPREKTRRKIPLTPFSFFLSFFYNNDNENLFLLPWERERDRDYIWWMIQKESENRERECFMWMTQREDCELWERIEGVETEEWVGGSVEKRRRCSSSACYISNVTFVSLYLSQRCFVCDVSMCVFWGVSRCIRNRILPSAL